jgi:hypothetical protein
MTLDAREGAVLETLNRLSKDNIVLIGGYAVNAYVPPRFSIDCDLVVLGSSDTIETELRQDGFKKAEEGDTSYGNYMRYEIEESKVSFDLLVNSVVDRDTGVAFEGGLFKEHSAERTTVGRSVPTRIKMRIADPELLFAMKFVSGRKQDTRDIFMLAGAALDWNVVRELIFGKCDRDLIKEKIRSAMAVVNSKSYRDSLQGPYGKMPDKRFEACQKNLTRFLEGLA